jgi:hypothetical protein
MSKSYRLRTQVGTDKNIRININQDFDFLEILSLKLRQNDVYTRFCADYGVVAGRVIVNGGYGVPNATVSIFIPLDQVDENDPVISNLYPYKTPAEKNEDGYRYNLLPYKKSYGGHTPTGTFPDKEDVLTRIEVLEVYEKYYKYTTTTNDSGDFMIVGVPLGIQTIVMDLDLSDMGCFSLRPKDLIRTGLGTPEQFDGENFKSSEDLASLPQIVNFVRDIDVTPFWGENELCNIGITRTDFDLRDLGIEIKPQAIFMGSIFSTSKEDFLRTNCKPKKDIGSLCGLETGPGKILSIRQTIGYDSSGRPVLEQFNLPNGGKVIDEDGAWLVELPMNIDYVTTNEFGEQVISNDPSVGIPTKGRYRFRVQYQNEDVENNTIQRADYLVPNIREYGWTDSGKYDDSNFDYSLQLKSYAFSLDWNDYADPQVAINCEDYFYEFNFNKVYTVANFIDRFKWGYNRNRHLGIKEIDSKECNQINKLPVNDGVRNFDLIFFLMMFLITIVSFLVPNILIILHVLALLYPIFRVIINLFIWLINTFVYSICIVVAILSPRLRRSQCKKQNITPISKTNPFKRISLPMMSYPDCESCPCTEQELDTSSKTESDVYNITLGNYSVLANLTSSNSFTIANNTLDSSNETLNEEYREFLSGFQGLEGNAASNKIIKVPFASQEVTPGWGKAPWDVSLAQSMNMVNFRARYFEGQNIIETTVNNTIPNTTTLDPSTPFTDSVLILLCDSQTLSNINAGQILTFNSVDNINDPNITGFTSGNQFGTTTITGSTPYNTNALVNKPLTYIDQSGNIQTINLKLNITSDGKEYKFKSGLEYFQLITGGTVSQFSAITNPSVFGGALNKYLFGKTQYLENWPSFPTSTQNDSYVYSIRNFDGFNDLEVLILSRGVDPYTDKQNIKYDLSKLFGYSSFGSGPIVEGSYYLNVPIQPNTVPNGSPTPPSWYNSNQSPESHLVTNNTNVSLYHQPFGFNVDTTQFSSFTNNNPYYYNSTDKSTTSSVAYYGDLYTLGFYLNGTGVYSPAFKTTDQTPLNKMGFQFGHTPSTLNQYVWLTDGIQYPFQPDACAATIDPLAFTNPLYANRPSAFPTVTKLYTNSNLTTPYDSSGYFIAKLSGTNTYYVLITDSLGTIQLNPVLCTTSGPTYDLFPNTDQGNIEGGTLIAVPGLTFQGSPTADFENARVYSFAYHTNGSNPNITVTNNNRLVFRSDRLPTSDVTEVSGNTSFSLHLNNRFEIYTVDDQGSSVAIPSNDFEATDNTFNAQDLSGDTSNAYTDAILNTLTCEGMVPITCYSGSGNNFGVETPCTDPIDNLLGQNTDSRVDGGCYFFVDKPLIVSIPNDIRYFREWRSRFRVTYAACRGIFSQVFQNNWLNGSLYMFSFKKQTTFNVAGEPKKYKYCGMPNSFFRSGQGTLFYTSGTTNSFFYRSSPYNGNQQTFVGQRPEYQPLGFGGYVQVPFGANNDRNLFFPTTIMDLGPRDLYTKEICSNPNFEGYLMKNLESSSYNDQGDVLNLAIISRFVNKNYWLDTLGLGDKSVNRFFSRSGDRLDGDIAQMFSINSEFGVVPFGDEEYDDNDLYVQGGTFNSVFGIFFSSDTASRNVLSPGVLTFSLTPPLLNYFGYTKTQEVPMYLWTSNPTAGQQTIFGTDNNEWYTNVIVANNAFYSNKYQSMSFQYAPASRYFNTTPTGQKGYIFNSDVNGNNDPNWTGTIQTGDSFVVGAPFHFYFGLNKGKTALNKFITNYIG